MAASITGVFTIIDRASGPMRKMEAQAVKTMAAIEGVGKTSDKLGGSSSSVTRSLEAEERNLRNVERSAKSTEQAVRGLDTSHRRASDGSSRLSNSLIRLSGVLGFFGRALAALKIPFFAAGITALAQAIGAAAGGLVALVPNVVTAAGAIGALPGIIAAAVQGFGGLAVALSGVGQALQAGISLQQQSGLNAMQMANQHRQSAEQIRTANNGILQSQYGVRNAEWALTTAQQQQELAQRSLTDARIEATRQMQDMRLAEQGAALGQRRAALQLREAQFTLAQAALDPTQTSLDMMGNQLAVQEARLNLHQQRINRSRASQDLALAQRRGGAAGSTQMIQARQGLVEANHSLIQSNEAVRQSLFDARSAQLALRDAQIQARQQTRLGTSSQQQFNMAMKQLSPEAQHFVRFIMGLRENFLQLRAAAGEQLFPALEQGFTNLLRLQPALEDTLRQTGGVVGRAFERITRSMTTPQRILDFRRIGAANNRILGMMGRALNNIGQGLTDLMIAARPFTHWLSSVVLGWTQMFRQSMAAGRATGDLRDKFDHVREVLEQFGRILSNVWGTMAALGKAARPLGDRLWDGAEKATQGWESFLESAQGAQEARQWFNDLYEPLHQLGQLTADLAGAWARLTVQGSFTDTVRGLRDAVPYLEKLMTNVSGMGPQTAELLTQIVRLFSNLPFGAITTFLKVLNRILMIVNDMIERFPILGDILAAALTASFGAKALGIVGRFAGKIVGLTGLFGKLRTAIIGADVAAAAGGGGGALSKILTWGGRGVAAAGGAIAARAAPVVARIAETRGGQAIARGAGAITERLGQSGLFRAISAQRELSRLKGLGSFYDTAAGKSASQLVAEQAATRTALVKTGLARLIGVAPGMSIGARAIPAVGWASLAANIARGTGLVGEETGHNMDPLDFLNPQGVNDLSGPIQKQMETISSSIKGVVESGDVKQIREWNKQLKIMGYETSPEAADAVKEFRDQLKDAASTARDVRIAQNLQGQLGQMNRITDKTVNQFGKTLAKMSPEARKQTLNALVAQAQVMERRGYLPKGAAADLRDGILDKWKNMDERARKQWRKVGDAIHDAIAQKAPAILRIAKTIGDAIQGFLGVHTSQSAQNFGAAGLRAAGAGLGGPLGTLLTMGGQALGRGLSRQELVQEIRGGGRREIRAFQRRMGITADGIWGPATAAAAAHASRRQLMTGIPARQAGGPVWPGQPFLVGERGPEVFMPPQRGHIVPNRRGGIGDASALMQMKHQGDLVLDDAGRSWRKRMSDTRAGIGKEMDNTRKNTIDNWKQISKSVDDQATGSKKSAINAFSDTQNTLRDRNQTIFSITDRNWSLVNKTISDNTKDAKQTATDNFNQLTQEALRQLTSMGFSRQAAQNAIDGNAGGQGGARGNTRNRGRNKGATGMRIPGIGLHDNVMVAPGNWAAPGELLVNRHTEDRVNRFLAAHGTSLGKEVAGESRPHWDHMHAKGGRVGGGPLVPGHSELKTGISQATEAVLKQFPQLVITSTTGGSHVSGSYHYLGEATDISGPSQIMYNASEWIKKSGLYRSLEEGIHNPNLSIAHGAKVSPSYYSSVWAEHANHIHMAVTQAALGAITGGLTGAGGQAINLKLPPRARGGVPAALVNRATKNVRDAMQARINQRVGAAGGGGVPNVATGPIQQMAKQMVMQMWGASQWGPFNQLEMSEAGWNPRAQNPSSGAAGLAQALPPSKYPAGAWPYTGLRSAKLQLEWMMGYIKDRYGSPSAAWAFHQANNWYGLGGRVPAWGGWNASGFDGVVSRPTVFGAGEGGATKERVQITPQRTVAKGPGKASVGAGGVNVHIDKIEYHREGDVAKQIKREFQLLAEDIDFSEVD